MKKITILSTLALLAISTFAYATGSNNQRVNFYDQLGRQVGHSEQAETRNGFSGDLSNSRINYYDQNGRSLGHSEQVSARKGFAN